MMRSSREKGDEGYKGIGTETGVLNRGGYILFSSSVRMASTSSLI